MDSQPRNQEKLPVAGGFATFTNGWLQWFKEVWQALGGINQTARASFSATFGTVPLGTVATQTVTANGAQVGDWVLLKPSANMSGVIFQGEVTAANQLRILAINPTTDSISVGAVSFSAIFFR